VGWVVRVYGVVELGVRQTHKNVGAFKPDEQIGSQRMGVVRMVRS
jgi:hypothetical protein